MDRSTVIGFRLAAVVVCYAIISITYFENAWVCGDAYINFRSIEQLFAGNGLVWNSHERVQVYTSPLWFFMVAATRWVSENL